MFAQIRKAVTAGFGAGLLAAASVIGKAAEAGTLDDTAVQQGIGAFIAAAAVVGWTTWRVKNAETPVQSR